MLKPCRPRLRRPKPHRPAPAKEEAAASATAEIVAETPADVGLTPDTSIPTPPGAGALRPKTAPSKSKADPSGVSGSVGAPEGESVPVKTAGPGVAPAPTADGPSGRRGPATRPEGVRPLNTGPHGHAVGGPRLEDLPTVVGPGVPVRKGSSPQVMW